MPTDESDDIPSFDDRIELLSYLITRENQQTSGALRILPRNLAHPVPLSFAEERLWFLDQLENGNPVYNLVRVERLTGNLDVDALAKSVAAVICRHEIFRTLFISERGSPIQIIVDSTNFLARFQDDNQKEASKLLKRIDLRSLPKKERLAEAVRFAICDSRTTFDLSRGPLLRVSLFELDDNERVFILMVHQIIFDWLSHDLFAHELAHFYHGFCLREPAVLPDLKIQYADFSLWQRDWISGDKFHAHLSFWMRRLSGNSPVLALPTDHARPVINSFRGARRSVVISETLTGDLKELSHAGKATLFMTMMAAFQFLLYRYTGQGDIIVGFPIDNRNLSEIEPLIGFFANTLVLRTDLQDNSTFVETLERVREEVVNIFAHQDLPFERLVDELHLPRDLSRNPLFQVMLIFQNHRFSKLELLGVSSEPIEIDSGTSKFDLTLSLAEREHKLIGFFEYSTDLFDHSTIERMTGHLQTLLEGIVVDPNLPVSSLPLLTRAEQLQLLVEWNSTEADYPRDSCSHELFEAQVERTPEAIAIEFDGKQLTFRELNAQANQLAHLLQKLGIGSEKLVAICVERSLEMVVGLLGILKAGGAYLPLDPAYPGERLVFMLEDAQVSVLLTQESLIEDRKLSMADRYRLSSILCSQMKVVCLDRDREEIAQQRDKNPVTQVRSDGLAYVIYTSGSTGKPKGVQISHRSVVNCLCAIGENVALTAKDVFFALTTISFDIAALELFLPLIRGAKLVLASRDEALDGRQLLDRLTECGVTAMQATPSAWQLLLDAGWRGSRNFKILCGGEALSRQLADQLLEGGASLWNLYGPTETSIWSTIAKVEPGESLVLIGRPIANTQIYILDSHFQPVPVGVHGELYIGGDGLARGYLNRPELTSEKFVANLFNDNPNSRLYRTGDLAKYRADGNIEFLGRDDHQVKIRGHRIELGEIETILNRHPAVKESVIVARDRDSSGEKELVGYVVSAQEAALSLSQLRRFLQAKLPDYMIPLFVFIDSLPLTPNGKIDRNALPALDGARPQLDQGFIEPRTEIEELVAQIWREVLKLDKIGVHDNFFELGGHSLLATRVVARLRISFNIDIALRKLFELPTVAGLAEHIEHLRHSQFGTSIAPIVPVDRRQALPLSFSQRRLWYLHKVDTNLSAYNIPAAFRVKGDLDSAALEQALNEMIARHEVLRSYVKEVDGQPRQEILPSLRIALPSIDLTRLPDEQAETEARRLFSADARQLYDLANAPLMRATLVKLAVDNHVFILNFHHIIADGSSLAIFYKELTALYDAARDNKAAPLARLAVQYADYAAWQQEWLKSSSFDTQLGYWKRQLTSLPEPCALPTDFDRPMRPTYRGARLAVELSEELTRSLKILSRQQSVTMFMTLLATFNILLSRISGQEDIVMGSTIAGRNYPETDGLIGFFINALPLRADLSGDPSFVTLLQRARELCLDAFTNQDVPFEKVVEEIRPRREAGRNPIFDILFNIADTSDRILTLAGCEVTKLARVDPEAKFDIVLQAPEVGGKIELAIVYNTALFREGRITLLLDQWAALLDQVASHPELPISQLSLVTDASRSVLPDPKEALDDIWEGAIHDLLAEQACRSPESLAVVDENQNWTYEEMNQCANRLAHCLIDSGTRPKDLIAIYARRSSSLIVALFGILKAGASFLILDPAYPAARTIDYLHIAQPKGWLQLEGSGKLPDDLLTCLDSLTMRCRMNVPQSKTEILRSLGACANTDPATIVTADDPAYVAFTSGSTGEPKGVLCRHGPITHFLPWQKDAFQLSEADRFAMLSGLAYSHLHRDVFTAISLGATLYIPNPSEARSPEYLIHWLERIAITVLHLTPALGQLLLTSGGACLPSVRRVFFGGDVLTMDEVACIRRLAPNATIGSFYGATETQRAVGYYEIADDLPSDHNESTKPVALGRGIKGVQLLVLNKSGQLAGVGEFGELFVRSPHLAEGYLGDEERTAQLFIVNPFTNDPQDRLYRTGEFGRYLADGNVEWAGRNDRRVNIRGFRVELEEIEIALKQHPAVKDAAVVVQDFDQSRFENPKSKIQNPKLDRRLVAYVATDEEGDSLIDLLRSFLSSQFPDYMVPAHFLILTSLPLSANGKGDYRSLLAMQFSAGVGTSTSPRDEVENKLCGILAELLGRSDVGIDENFFRIGGHSLLAARAAVRIGDTFGVNLDLSTFLENPTVMGLAKKVDSLRATGQTRTESDKDQREEFDL
jgi:amino acid adenylation domain-containing protein